MKTCYELYREKGIYYQCCESCHEDWEDFGIEMRFLKVDDEEFHVCCRAPENVV